MPSTVASLLATAHLELQPHKVVRWGTAPKMPDHGVYVVSRLQDPEARGEPTDPRFDHDAVTRLLAACPHLTLDGHTGPSPQALTERLGAFWLPDEPVLYIGKADVPVTKRVTQYYGTRIGARSPHKGGWFIKTLAELDRLWVHCVASPRPQHDEEVMLTAFVDNISAMSLAEIRDPEKPLPFANLQRRRGGPKKHGIKNATIAR